ncbi:MAG: acetyltransferase [Desulfobacteraceae bacterium 4572_130]|nr:MAG: acetyltransferase [Desulfobacteraceae bacterium 4572_130]
MQKDYRPYYIKKLWFRLQKFYVRYFLMPQLEYLGKNPFIVKPWHIEIFGSPIKIGNHVTLLAAPDKKTRLTVWSEKKYVNGIEIGDHVLISPGVRISAAENIVIKDNCMLASGVYITDSDWHGIYNRSMPPEKNYPVKLESNVWVGDSSIVCKGVTIGENTIIGAGSVVTTDIESNCIAAGNPAKIVKKLDTNKKIITRKDRFSDSNAIKMMVNAHDKEILEKNTFMGWVKSFFFL